MGSIQQHLTNPAAPWSEKVKLIFSQAVAIYGSLEIFFDNMEADIEEQTPDMQIGIYIFGSRKFFLYNIQDQIYRSYLHNLFSTILFSLLENNYDLVQNLINFALEFINSRSCSSIIRHHEEEEEDRRTAFLNEALMDYGSYKDIYSAIESHDDDEIEAQVIELYGRRRYFLFELNFKIRNEDTCKVLNIMLNLIEYGVPHIIITWCEYIIKKLID